MKKVRPETTSPDSEASTGLAPVAPIRTETTLSRYPIHQLAKRGKVEIRETTKNEREQIVSWTVRNPPGPLAYKLDTLIINRRIDELRPNIPQLIKLGSLKEICRALDLGGDTATAKEALYENVEAVIITKLAYTDVDGVQRTFEYGASRYGVIFAGETLPDGRKADAVYLDLNHRYYELLLRSKTRPLDYEYLKKLAPAAQRLYELLSFAMFGALKYGRPNAQLRYSEFCQSAPLTRHYDRHRMHSQMRKIHQPHIANEYFEKVEFVETVDAEGKLDWLLKYKPGRRAKIEYATFTAKQQRQEHEPVLRLAPAPKTAPPPAAPPPLSAEETALLQQLTAHGISARKARQFVTERRAAVERELQAFAFRDQSGVKDPAAWLVRAIERGDYSAPPKLAMQQQRQEQQVPAAAQTQQQTQQQPAYEDYLRTELLALETRCPAALQVFAQEFAEIQQLVNFGDTPHAEAELATFRQFVVRNPSLNIMTFNAWARAQHQQ